MYIDVKFQEQRAILSFKSEKRANNAFNILMTETKWRLLAFILLLRSLIVLSAFSLNHRLELSDSRGRYCRQVKVETDGRHGHTDVHETTDAMVIEYILTIAYHLVFTRGIWTRQTRITSFPFPSFSFDKRTGILEEGEKSICTPFAREIGALRDALAVGKGGNLVK